MMEIGQMTKEMAMEHIAFHCQMVDTRKFILAVGKTTRDR